VSLDPRDDTPDVGQAAPAPNSPGSVRRALGWTLALTGFATVLTVWVTLMALWMALHSQMGAVQVLSWVPGLTVVDPQGQFRGDFQASRLSLRLPRGGRLEMLEPRWQGLDVHWSAFAPWRMAVSMKRLQARSVDLQWVTDPKAPPATAPSNLVLPVALSIEALTVGRLTSNLWAGVPMTDLKGQLSLQQLGLQGAGHRVVLQSLNWQGWQGQGELSVKARSPMGVSATVQVQSAQGAGELKIGGTVLAPEVSGEVRVAPLQASAVHAAPPTLQRLTVLASLRPFDPWPVHRAQIDALGLNLQQLLPSLPLTALSGQVSVMPREAIAGAPGSKAGPMGAAGRTATPGPMPSDLLVQVDLRNDRPGLWDALAFPLLAAKGRLTLPAQASVAAIGQVGHQGELDLLLTLPGQGVRATASVAMSGPWDLNRPAGTRLSAQLDRVDLRSLDSRAPPLVLKGLITAQGQGAPGAAAMEVGLEGALDGVVPRDATGVPPTLVGQTANVRFKAAGGAASWQLSSLSMSSGAAQLQASGQWRPVDSAGAQTWQAQGQIALQAFDPALWMPWPRPPGDAMQRTRLDGQLQARLTGPADMASWWQTLVSTWLNPGKSPEPANGSGRVAGTVSGEVKNSLLLGVPLSAQWQLQADSVWQARADLQSGSNSMKLDATAPLDARGRLGAAQLHGSAQVPNLNAWQAWAEPLGWRELAGRLQADGDMRLSPGGLWAGQGQLRLEGLKALKASTPLSAQTVSATWQFNAEQAQGPWKLDAQVDQARWAQWQLPQAHLLVQGPRSAHQISLQAMAVLPPRKRADAEPVSERVNLDLQGQAALTGSGDTLAWAAKVQSLKIQPEAKGSDAWLAMAPFDLQWQPLPQTGAAHWHQWRMSPTQATVFGTRLTVSQASWRQGPTGADTLIQIGLDPVKLAEVLGRWQPQVGWGGDLLVAGQVKVQQDAGGRWVVDAGIERQSGDLTLREPGIQGATEQSLGVRSAKFSLRGADGVWRLTEQLDARVLGVLNGEQRLVTASASELPKASDALTGKLQLKLDNLRTVSVWAPAGWRLGGKASADLQVTGTLAVPGLLGRLIGQELAISNPLLGVQLNRGELSVRFGDRDVVIERFSAEGGPNGGRVDATGRALWTPEDALYELQVKATRFALLQRVDRRATVSGDLAVQVNRSTLKADGQLRMDEGLVDISQADAPTVGDDVNVVNRSGVVDGDEASAPGRKLAINLGMDLGKQLRLKGRGLDTHLAGQVRLTTPNGRLHVQGTIQAVDGTYAAYGQRLQIERGSLAFTGSLDNPRLDIQAMRPQSPTAAASDVKVGVLISGTAQEPRVRLYSEPAMSETEKLSWLVLGRAPAGLNGADIGLLQTAAYAFFDGEGPSVRDNLIQTLGLDELSVRQTDGAVRDTIVAVGKQVSSKWYVGYERSLNATTGTWQAIYRLAKRFTVRLQSGDDNAIDLIWSKRWGE
jgi:translocation and assembly module TamB